MSFFLSLALSHSTLSKINIISNFKILHYPWYLFFISVNDLQCYCTWMNCYDIVTKCRMKKSSWLWLTCHNLHVFIRWWDHLWECFFCWFKCCWIPCSALIRSVSQTLKFRGLSLTVYGTECRVHSVPFVVVHCQSYSLVWVNLDPPKGTQNPWNPHWETFRCNMWLTGASHSISVISALCQLLAHGAARLGTDWQTCWDLKHE